MHSLSRSEEMSFPTLPSQKKIILDIPEVHVIPPESKKSNETTGEDSILRSRQMSLLQLYIPVDIAKASIAEIGSISLFQFRNLNASKLANQLAYASELVLIDDAEKRLSLLVAEAEAIGIWKRSDVTLAEVEAAASLVINNVHMKGPLSARPALPASLQELSDTLCEVEKRIIQLKSSEEELEARKKELVSRSAVLIEVELLFSEKEDRGQDETDEVSDNLLGFVGGLICRSKIQTLEGLLWRALRGHLFFHSVELIGDEEMELYIVGAHGETSLSKVRRLALSLGATVVTVAGSDAAHRAYEASQASQGLTELERVLASTAATKRSMIVGLTSSFPVWRAYLLKERAVYEALNMCQLDDGSSALSMAPTPAGGCLVAEGWCATYFLPQLKATLERARARQAAAIGALCSELRVFPLDKIIEEEVEEKENDESEGLYPPTDFVTNKVTRSFQDLINSYGIPTYGEINPALFTIITFPFLFGVMFGDVGHGLILFLLALYLVVKERSLTRSPPVDGDIWEYLFGGRYIILFMGLWSIYLGIIYNDCFSRSMNIFKSVWTWVESTDAAFPFTPIQGGVPIFGMDSAWISAENGLLFLNAFKTKQAILLGMIQMLFGLSLSAFNYIFKKDRHSFFGIFLPQILFLSSTFGYLTLLFIAKWIRQTPSSPSLLLIFVDMFLSPGHVDPSRKFYFGQALIQSVLLIIALVCVPWMLLYRPIALYFDAKKTNKKFAIGDELIHSAIHTVEFSLAAISNTASYLRLWALSLAHSQLSEVLWNLLVEFIPISPLVGVVVFIIWFTLTIAILVAMEGLSAFLHALRLHWVEFNNKFFKGEGIAFEPLSLPTLLSKEAIRSFGSSDDLE